ncbi:3'-5' exonuclease [Lentzea jiangxiensis]|uniref:3'-5' exonuclease n=1 Tax=Lentzea jiangxiensis TaxID=641025 RepID=UPI003CCB9BF4
MVPPPADPLGDPRRHPRSLPQPGLRHHLLAPTPQPLIELGVLIGHNAHVDVGVIQRKLGDWECPEVFDTLKLARRLLPGLPSYKLSALVEKYELASGLDGEEKPHRAKYDAIVTARLFVLLAGRRSLEELRDQPAGGGSDEEPALF